MSKIILNGKMSLQHTDDAHGLSRTRNGTTYDVEKTDSNGALFHELNTSDGISNGATDHHDFEKTGNGALSHELPPHNYPNRIHPLLQGGQPIAPHRFSDAQMRALTAIFDCIFPSITDIDPADYVTDPAPPHYDHHLHQHNSHSEDFMNHHESMPDCSQAYHEQLRTIEAYFHLSGADLNLPAEGAAYISKLLKKSQYWLIYLSLWLLGNRWGTLVLGGKHALTSSFPFIHSFAALPPTKREKFWLALGHSCLQVRQEVFKFFKGLVGWVVFTKVDIYGRNPVFAAIGYEAGGDDDDDDDEETAHVSSSRCELAKRVVDASVAGDRLGDELAARGLEMLSDVEHLRRLERRPRGRAAPTKGRTVGVRCDAVVVGSGPGGAVVAARLAGAGHRVLVLEKGGYFPPPALSQLEGPTMNTMYEEHCCLITDDSRMLLLAGSTVGGGSTVNWSASFRTPPHVRSEWARVHSLPLFASPAYDRALDAVCQRMGVQPDVAREGFQNAALRAGCAALGCHVDTIPRNSPPLHHCGRCGLGCRQGKKRGAMLTWLEDAAAAGAVVLTSCRAEQVLSRRVVLQAGRRRKAAGVVAEVAGGARVYVEAEVVVAACGALRTPPLLRRSGLQNPAIGRNLHIHPTQVVWGYFPRGTGPDGVCYRGGIMTAYSNVAANWDTSGYGALIQCPAALPGVMSLSQSWLSGRDYKERMARYARTAFFIVLTRDQGSGTIDVDGDDRLCVRYAMADVDKEASRRGAEHALRILLAAGATRVGAFDTAGETFSPPRGCPEADVEAAFQPFVRRLQAGSFNKLSTMAVSAHQMGSCRMGASPSTSAVNPGGETWEVEGLYVADSSVFPTASGVNPMITVSSIAYCTADTILSHFRKRQ